MKKFTLLLGLTLLWGGTNVVAQNVSDYKGLNEAVDAAKSAAADVVAAQKAYDAALATYNNWPVADRKIPNTIAIDANKDYETFIGDFNNDATSEIKIWAGVPTKTIFKYVVFATEEVKKYLGGIEWLGKDDSHPDGQAMTVDLLNSNWDKWNLPTGRTFNSARIYYKKNDAATTSDFVTYTNASSFSEDEANAAYVFIAYAWENLRASIPMTQEGDPIDNSNYIKAGKDAEDALKTLETATGASNKTIILAANIIDFGKTISELPSNCTLDGQGYSINSSSALFGTNKGTIKNLANANGFIATENEGKMNYCLEKRNATTYRTYISNTNYEDHKNVSIEEVIAGLSGFSFGYNVATGVITPGKDLYQAYYASAKNKTLYSFFVNIDNEELSYNKDAFLAATKEEKDSICKNTILYIDANVNVTGKNIAVKKNGVYTSDQVELTNYVEFYIPMNVTAKALSYDRKFGAGYSSVCLPFAMQLSDDLKAYQFSNISADNTTMWFRRYNTVAANTPYLIYSEKGGKLFENVDNVELVATPAQLLTEIGDVDFCGVYKKSLVSDLIQNNDYAVYGIAGGRLVKASSDPSKSDILMPFRSYVYCKAITEENGAPAYKIGLLEDDDTETGIETVATDDAEGLGVKGGENAVEITTDKACKVNVYTMNGMLVKSEAVEAGTTALPLKAGMYVVNGVKVIVK